MTVSDLGRRRAGDIGPGDTIYRDGHDPFDVDTVRDDGSGTVTFSGVDADDWFALPADTVLEVS